MEKAMENIFRVNLAVRPDERVLVFTDTLGPDETVDELDAKRREATARTARRIAEAGGRFARCEFVSYPSVKSHGAEPPPVIWEKTFGHAAVEKLRWPSVCSCHI